MGCREQLYKGNICIIIRDAGNAAPAARWITYIVTQFLLLFCILTKLLETFCIGLSFKL